MQNCTTIKITLFGVIISGFFVLDLGARSRRSQSLQSHHLEDAVVEIDNAAKFKEEVLDNAGQAIVKFYATWCGACKQAKQPFEELAEEVKDVKFIAVNVDENRDLADKYKVNGIPHFVTFDHGKEITTKTGFNGKKSIKNMLKK